MCGPAQRVAGFQSTRPRGARRRLDSRCQRRAGFNPRAREGRDPFRSNATCPRACFNPRAREGRDPACSSPGSFTFCFNPRAREGRDIVDHAHIMRLPGFQSTRPRGARPTRILRDDILQSVSIHAPARGATGLQIGDHPDDQFQSTRPRGARPTRFTLKHSRNLFQSTRPRGARPRQSAFPCRPFPVSIHAPARGATCGNCIDRFGFLVSIHAPARGATCEGPDADGGQEFQSTRPRGARPYIACPSSQ